jgi:hypothetical protein
MYLEGGGDVRVFLGYRDLQHRAARLFEHPHDSAGHIVAKFGKRIGGNED